MDLLLPMILGLLFLFVIIITILAMKIMQLKKDLEDINFEKSSQSVRYGKITEQFIPFASDLPFNASNFRFIGSPIDGMAFESDRIIFCEFKTADSQLSKKQKHIKHLVEGKKVEWAEVRKG
ncbi:MAG: Holliday junction resolvase-like protein [Candidatus Diapherotrites archaeon]